MGNNNIRVLLVSCIAKPEFTKAQIAKCKKCKWVSAKKRWCGKWACWIGGAGQIVRPNKNISPPSRLQMASSFAKEAGRFVAAGAPCRPEAEQARLKAICKSCRQPTGEPMLFLDPQKGPRCRVCGCCTNVKTLWATAHCPRGKW